MAVPTKRTPTEACAIASSVTATPVIERGGSEQRSGSAASAGGSSRTASAPLPAMAKRTRPPSAGELEPTSRRTSVGPSEP